MGTCAVLTLSCLQLTLNNRSFVIAKVNVEMDFRYDKMDETKNEIVSALSSFPWNDADRLVPTISGSL